MNNTIPLPEPIAWTSSRNGGKTWITTDGDPTDLMPDEGGIVHSLHTDNQIRIYAAAVTAERDARIKVLEDALRKACDDMEGWGLYAPEYFREKHDFVGDVEAARAALGDKT